jgi:hypothetical protein
MVANKNLILAGVAGGGDGVSLAWVAPLTATAPTTATAPLGAGWLSAGWCADTGLVTKLAESTKEITAFGTTSPVRTLITSSIENFDVAFLESNPTTLAIYNRKPLGSLTVDSSGATDFESGTPDLPHFQAVFDLVDGNNHLRVVCTDVAVTARVDLTVAPGTPIQYGVTLTAYPDSSGNSVHWYYVLDALKAS